MSKKPSIVVIGGGTGVYTALIGLKQFDVRLTAIVTMMDSGGSSGRLRDEFGHLPPGDVRRCLVALSENNEVNLILRTLFDYRFEKGNGLTGHNFGNLFLTALTEITGRSDRAIEEAGKILRIRGRVLPVTLSDVQLCARLEDGSLIYGETNIDVRKFSHGVRIKEVFLDRKAEVFPQAVEALEKADLIVIGPGDLYTSVVPNLLIPGFAQAINAAKARKVYVCNLMTKPGETDNFKASDFARKILEYLSPGPKLDMMIVNDKKLPSKLIQKYATENAFPVEFDRKECENLVPRVVSAKLVTGGDLLRHDSVKLARSILSAADLPVRPGPQDKLGDNSAELLDQLGNYVKDKDSEMMALH